MAQKLRRLKEVLRKWKREVDDIFFKKKELAGRLQVLNKKEEESNLLAEENEQH